jgi:hypothetical protein
MTTFERAGSMSLTSLYPCEFICWSYEIKRVLVGGETDADTAAVLLLMQSLCGNLFTRIPEQGLLD